MLVERQHGLIYRCLIVCYAYPRLMTCDRALFHRTGYNVRPERRDIFDDWLRATTSPIPFSFAPGTGRSIQQNPRCATSRKTFINRPAMNVLEVARSSRHSGICGLLLFAATLNANVPDSGMMRQMA